MCRSRHGVEVPAVVRTALRTMTPNLDRIRLMMKPQRKDPEDVLVRTTAVLGPRLEVVQAQFDASDRSLTCLLLVYTAYMFLSKKRELSSPYSPPASPLAWTRATAHPNATDTLSRRTQSDLIPCPFPTLRLISHNSLLKPWPELGIATCLVFDVWIKDSAFLGGPAGSLTSIGCCVFIDAVVWCMQLSNRPGCSKCGT